jgi:hypothetical protein
MHHAPNTLEVWRAVQRRSAVGTSMQKPRASTGLLASDRVVSDGAFLAYLSGRGLTPRTVEHVRWAVRHAARWLARRKQSLLELRRGALPAMLAASTPASWSWWAQKDYKSGLACWFRFRSPDAARTKPTYVWQHWIDDFIQFLETHCGLAPSTRRADAIYFVATSAGSSVKRRPIGSASDHGISGARRMLFGAGANRAPSIMSCAVSDGFSSSSTCAERVRRNSVRRFLASSISGNRPTRSR